MIGLSGAVLVIVSVTIGSEVISAFHPVPCPDAVISLPEPSSLGIAIAASDSVVWVADSEGRLTSIDPLTQIPTPRAGLPGVTDIALGPDVLWVAGYFGGHPQAAFPSAYLLDQTDGTTRATIDLTPTVQQRKPCHFHPSLVLDADTAWVANRVRTHPPGRPVRRHPEPLSVCISACRHDARIGVDDSGGVDG